MPQHENYPTHAAAQPTELITGVPVFDKSQLQVPTGFQDDGWEYTHAIKRREGGDTYQGRHIIGRDSALNGGVYTGTYGGEAIVVDTEKYPDEFEELLSDVRSRIVDKSGREQRGKVLGAVFDVVSEKMRYSQEGVEKILGEIAENQGRSDFRDGTKIPLNEFILEGVGVCRHQALAAGVLLERLKDDGLIRGQVSVDRSQRWSPKGEPEGHAWVRYTSHSGAVVILDVAQGYFGPLEDSEGRKRGWDYLRPEEQRERVARNAGNQAIGPQLQAT